MFAFTEIDSETLDQGIGGGKQKLGTRLELSNEPTEW